MDLNEIVVFLEVVQAGSFSGAARELNMPNSTVSAKVSSLERRLGVTLLQRTTRKISVTEAGQAFYNRCIRGMDELKGAEAEVTASQKDPQGVLRITAPTTLGTSLLPKVIAQYAAKFPKVRMELIFTDEQIDLVGQNIDVALRAGELKDSTLIARKIGETYFAPFTNQSYLKKHGTPSHPKDLKDHQCLEFSSMTRGPWQFVHENKSKVNVMFSGNIIVDNLDMIKKLAVYGSGIALLPAFLCEAEVKTHKLIRLLPEWSAEKRIVSLVYPSHKFITPKLKSFVEFSSNALKEQLAASVI